MMFDRILVPLDGSPVAETILGQVERILRRADSEVLILRVAPVPTFPYTEIPVLLPRPADEAELYVKQVSGRLSDRGARARGIALEGSPAGEILEAAEREKATLIAMSTHGRTGLARWAFGSVTEKVLRASPIPLLVLRSFEKGARTSEAPIAIKKILVPIERLHLGIVPYVREVAELFGSKVCFLHVVEPGEDPGARSKSQGEAEAAGRELIDAGIPAVILERMGWEPAEEILRVADEEGVGLIAISARGRRGPTRWVLGSMTEKVLRSATAPLLVVRHPPP